MHISTLLPNESLIPFNAFRVNTPATVWSNALLPAGDLHEHAFSIPLPGDPEHAYDRHEATFLGERYGGSGLGHNGGGVRCGLSGAIQIKGIGKNSLAGNGTDFFHSYGGASLNEGIVEALWGEILNFTLPYGAVRIYGLLTTGTRVPLLNPKEGCDPTTARALILRQPTLRLAHYMRAIHFRPGEQLSPTASDTQRTRAAVLGIGQAFASVYGNAPADNLDPAYLNQCLNEMFGRIASQIAAARARRIMHGSLIASNLSLNGAFLDFGTTSALPDYGRIYISPGVPDFMEEEMLVKDALQDFSFYLRKYLPNNRGQKLDSAEILWQKFYAVFDLRQEMEFLKLSGIPESVLAQLPLPLRQNAYRSFRKIIKPGNKKAHSIFGKHQVDPPRMPDVTGVYHLNSILYQAALCTSPTELAAELQSLLSNDALRQEFIEHYWALRSAAAALVPGENAARYVLFNALRLNAPRTELYRPELYAAVETLLLANGDVTDFIAAKMRLARTLLAEPVNDSINLAAWFDQAITLSFTDGFQVEGQPISFDQAMASLHDGILETAHKNRIFHHVH